MFTLVGVITNTHGIKGGVKVYPYTYDVNRFNEYGSVYLGDEKEKVHIENVSFHKNLVILNFEEYNNINEVLKFKEYEIFIKSEDRKELEENQFYLGEILDIEVFDINNNYLGKVNEIIRGPKNDVYVIKNENITGLVPAVREFIKEVDTEKNKMTIDPIEGMFSED